MSNRSRPRPPLRSRRPGGRLGGPRGPIPIDGYDDLNAAKVLPKLRLLTSAGLARVEDHERTTKGRKRILERIATLRSEANGSHPADPRL